MAYTGRPAFIAACCGTGDREILPLRCDYSVFWILRDHQFRPSAPAAVMLRGAPLYHLPTSTLWAYVRDTGLHCIFGQGSCGIDGEVVHHDHTWPALVRYRHKRIVTRSQRSLRGKPEPTTWQRLCCQAYKRRSTSGTLGNLVETHVTQRAIAVGRQRRHHRPACRIATSSVTGVFGSIIRVHEECWRCTPQKCMRMRASQGMV